MDAKSILSEIGEAFAHAKLKVVMIGNAAAAIQGAPVTTMDIDFCIRETGDTVSQLGMVAKRLDAELILRFVFSDSGSGKRNISGFYF
jgi:hypothetical protein